MKERPFKYATVNEYDENLGFCRIDISNAEDEVTHEAAVYISRTKNDENIDVWKRNHSELRNVTVYHVNNIKTVDDAILYCSCRGYKIFVTGNQNARPRLFIERINIGDLSFGDNVDITDPCYNRDVWCRINEFKIVPGEYLCEAVLYDEGSWGKRVAQLNIYLDGKKQHEFVRVGEIGVDGGMAGIYSNKPDFSDDLRGHFYSNHGEEKFWIDDYDGIHGVTTSSGYGDGGYEVYAHYNEYGVADAVRIIYIYDERDDE